MNSVVYPPTQEYSEAASVNNKIGEKKKKESYATELRAFEQLINTTCTPNPSPHAINNNIGGNKMTHEKYEVFLNNISNVLDPSPRNVNNGHALVNKIDEQVSSFCYDILRD